MADSPELPTQRGPVSAATIALLKGDGRPPLGSLPGDLGDDDLQLALYMLYELHYRSWRGVSPDREWDPEVLRARSELEAHFLCLLDDVVPVRGPVAPADVPALLRGAIEGASGPSLSSWVECHGQLAHLQELAVHRSSYQLKEADPHTWAIPRLPAGRAKSALLTLQFDEYGNGVPGATHAELFANTMRSLHLDSRYGAYLDQIPGVTLATVNLLSFFGLHRNWVGACLGHLAVFEMTSVVPMTRYAAAHRRVAGDEGASFYDVHVIADATHELIAIDELIPALVADDRELGTDILFGADALMALECRLAEHILASWQAGQSSLRHAVPSLALAS